MNKIKLAKHILFLCFGAAILIFSLVIFILSKQDSGTYSYPLVNGQEFYERDFEFDMNAVIGILLSISFLIYGAYSLIQDKKNLSNKQGFHVMITLIPFLIGSYATSVFFKALIKAGIKEKEFPYTAYQTYLYIGIVSFIFFAYGILSYLDFKKKNIND